MAEQIKDRSAALNDAVKGIKDLTTRAGTEDLPDDQKQGFQLQVGEAIRDLLDFFSTEHPDLVNPKEENDDEQSAAPSPADILFG